MSSSIIAKDTPVRNTPFSAWPIFDNNEEKALLRVLHSGKWWRFAFGQGIELAEPEEGSRSEVVTFQEDFAAMHDCKYGIATANGTASLEMGIRAMQVNVGDEIIVPAYTYIASATCILQNNMVPIFVDIDPDTYNIDPEKIEEAITDRTKAIMVVHFGGQPVDFDKIIPIAEKYNLPIIEDAAHAHGCEWKGQKAGSFGLFSSFSFQASKNMTSGEGGIICTNDKNLAERCESLLWSGREVGRPWYEFHRLGWNNRLTEFQGAILGVQLNRLEEQTLKRQKMSQYLSSKIEKLEGINPLIHDSRTTKHGYHIYMFRYDEKVTSLPRTQFINALEKEGIPAFGGYTFPLYKNPMFINKEFINGSFPLGTEYHEDIDYASFAEKCPVAEKACNSEAVWLPQNIFLGTEEDMDDIYKAITKVLQNS